MHLWVIYLDAENVGKCVEATCILLNFIYICGTKENEDRAPAHPPDCSAPALSDISPTAVTTAQGKLGGREKPILYSLLPCFFPPCLFIRIMVGPHAETTS